VIERATYIAVTRDASPPASVAAAAMIFGRSGVSSSPTSTFAGAPSGSPRASSTDAGMVPTRNAAYAATPRTASQRTRIGQDRTRTSSARTRPGAGPEGVSLFLLPKGTKGLAVTLLPTMDQTRKLCEVACSDVTVGADALLGAANGGWAPLARVLDRATVALCAEMCGGAQKVLDMTMEYAKIRIAFGKPIGSYQGVKHKAADMLVDVENAKSLTYYAAWAVDENVPEAALAASMAKAYASDAFRKVAGAGIQLHGGIGFTWEHDLHLYFKRAKSSEFTFGDSTYHRERVAQLINL